MLAATRKEWRGSSGAAGMAPGASAVICDPEGKRSLQALKAELKAMGCPQRRRSKVERDAVTAKRPHLSAGQTLVLSEWRRQTAVAGGARPRDFVESLRRALAARKDAPPVWAAASHQQQTEMVRRVLALERERLTKVRRKARVGGKPGPRGRASAHPPAPARPTRAAADAGRKAAAAAAARDRDVEQLLEEEGPRPVRRVPFLVPPPTPGRDLLVESHASGTMAPELVAASLGFGLVGSCDPSPASRAVFDSLDFSLYTANGVQVPQHTSDLLDTGLILAKGLTLGIFSPP